MTQYADAMRIPASPTELQKLAQRIGEANLASERATELFTMFCEGHGIAGATFVGIENGEVIVSLPEQKPELVKDAG